MIFEKVLCAYDEHIKKFVVFTRFANVFESLRALQEGDIGSEESQRILREIQAEIWDSQRAGFEPESHKLLHEVHVAVGMHLKAIDPVVPEDEYETVDRRSTINQMLEETRSRIIRSLGVVPTPEQSEQVLKDLKHLACNCGVHGVNAAMRASRGTIR